MNNKKIYENVKMKIAISKLNEEGIAMKQERLSLKRRFAIVASIMILLTGVCYGKEIKEFAKKLFGENASDGVNIAIENDYVANPNTDYIESNGIEVSINSFLLDDYNFDISFNLKFSDDYNIDEMLKLDIMNLKVTNENGEKIFATRESDNEEAHNLYETEQEARKYFDYYNGAYSSYAEKINDKELIYYLTATGNSDFFPEANKLIVSFSKIGIDNHKLENFEKDLPIYVGNWNYNIEVPEKMAKRSLEYYEVKEINDNNLLFDKAILSNTAFKVYLNNAYEIDMNYNDYIENSKGEVFKPSMRSDGDGGLYTSEDNTLNYYNTFNLTSSNATDTLKLHLFKKDGKEVIIELIKKI